MIKLSKQKQPNPQKRPSESESEKSETQQKDTKNWHQKTTTPNNRKTGSPPPGMAKKQQTKTTKHTIEFSNNRLLPHRPRSNPATRRPRIEERTGGNTLSYQGYSRGCRRAPRLDRVAATALSYVPGNLESNRLLGGIFQIVGMLNGSSAHRPRSASRGAARAIVRTGSPR